MILCRKDAEKLVLMIHRGQNTYKDIRLAFPNMHRSTLYDLIADPFVMTGGESDPREIQQINRADILLRFQKRPPDFHPHYAFHDTDAFILAEGGEDVLYQLEKERKSNMLLWIGAICGAIAAITGVLSLTG
jgi:hypothetical protein